MPERSKHSHTHLAPPPSVMPNLTVGQRLEIGVAHLGQTHWFTSRVEARDGAGQRLALAWPTDRERRLLDVQIGHGVQVMTSAQDALYSALAQVEDTDSHSVPPIVIVRLAHAWNRAQRRTAVRVGLAIKPRLAARLVGDVRKHLRLGITNLSAGGLQVRSQDELRVGDCLELDFDMSAEALENVYVFARVRRVQRVQRPSGDVWEAGCEFEGASPRLIERVVHFIFFEQRAQARNRRNRL